MMSFVHMSLGGSFGFQYCEHVIQTDHKKDPVILLYCQSNEEYKYCSVGKIINNEQEMSNYCKYNKYSWSNNGRQFLRREECYPTQFFSHIWHYRIEQSDLDCKIQLIHFKAEGNYFLSKSRPSIFLITRIIHYSIEL